MAGTTELPSLLYTTTPSQVNRATPDAVRQLVKQALIKARVAIPAFLTEDMDPGPPPTVTVQIALQERVRTATGPQWWDIEPIVYVPIVLPRGGGFSLTLPLKKGDEGLLVFCDMCLDNWWLNGQQNAPRAQNLPDGTPTSGSQKQNVVRRHYIHDCGFVPGMNSLPNALSDWSTDAMQLRNDDKTTVVEIKDGLVTITANNLVVKLDDAAHKVTVDNGGTPLALVNDTWFQWWQTNIFPFLQSKGYAGPGIPVGSETTVLKAE